MIRLAIKIFQAINIYLRCALSVSKAVPTSFANSFCRVLQNQSLCTFLMCRESKSIRSSSHEFSVTYGSEKVGKITEFAGVSQKMAFSLLSSSSAHYEPTEGKRIMLTSLIILIFLWFLVSDQRAIKT